MLPSALRQREVTTSGWTWAACDCGALLCSGTWSQVGLPRGHFAGRMSNQERSFATGEQSETAGPEAFKCKVLSREFAKADSREIKVGKCMLLQNQRLLALKSRQQRSPPPARRAKQNNGEWLSLPQTAAAWPSLQTSAPGMHLPGRTDLEAAKCTCSLISHHSLGGDGSMDSSITLFPPSCFWLAEGCSGEGSFQFQHI